MSAFGFNRRRLFGLALFVFVLILALPQHSANAQNNLDVLDKGPKVGETLPHPLTLVDQNNQKQEFSALKRKRGLILLFSRSFDW